MGLFCYFCYFCYFFYSLSDSDQQLLRNLLVIVRNNRYGKKWVEYNTILCKKVYRSYSSVLTEYQTKAK